jgi:hypothetical protein
MDKFLCNICNQNTYEKKWIPTTVSDFEEIIGRKINYKNLRKNIVYNLQFLQFINEYVSQIYLTSVIYTLTCKIFVIITAGIIEGILFYEINARELQKKSIWNFLKSIVSNENVLFDGKTLKLETSIFEKLENEKDEEMKFEQMLNIAESKNIFGTDHKIYEKLNGLRKLRNKVHIHIIEHFNDTDYNNYDYTKIELAKDVLLYILKNHFQLTDNEVDNKFDFLKAKSDAMPF